MKMRYHLKSKPDKSGRNKIIFVSVLFIILSLAGFLFPNALRTISFAIARPLWSARLSLTDFLINIKDYFIFQNILILRNKELENELASLKLKEIDYGILTIQNQELKNLLGRTDFLANFIISRVLSKPPYSSYDTLIIDIGLSDGVSKGDKVYLSDNIIIGTVKNSTPRSSQVELFSSGNSKVEAVLSRTGETLELLGQGGANFKVEVPKDMDIVLGDMFVYPSISPAALGSVYYIYVNSQSSFKTIYLRIPGNIFSSKYIFVESQKQ